MGAAKVFINDDPTKGMPWATEYYLRYPDHIVTKDLAMKRAKVVPFSPFHFVDLVKSMDVHCQPGDDVILVCHGMPTTLGIYPKAGSTSWADRFFVNGIVNDFATMVDIMGLSFDETEKLSDGLFRLRAKRLNHIAIQACRIG